MWLPRGRDANKPLTFGSRSHGIKIGNSRRTQPRETLWLKSDQCASCHPVNPFVQTAWLTQTAAIPQLITRSWPAPSPGDNRRWASTVRARRICSEYRKLPTSGAVSLSLMFFVYSRPSGTDRVTISHRYIIGDCCQQTNLYIPRGTGWVTISFKS